MDPKMDPKIDPKIAQNARKARLRPRTLLGGFWCRFWLIWGIILVSFLAFLATMHKYAQIQAKRRNDAQNTCKC